MTTAATEQSKGQTLTATQQYWLEHLQNQQSSGLSMAAYAKSQGIAAHNFYYWAQQLRKQQQANALTATPLFQAVALVSSQSPRQSNELGMVFRLPNRIECELRHADEQTVLAVMQSLARVSL